MAITNHNRGTHKSPVIPGQRVWTNCMVTCVGGFKGQGNMGRCLDGAEECDWSDRSGHPRWAGWSEVVGLGDVSAKSGEARG